VVIRRNSSRPASERRGSPARRRRRRSSRSSSPMFTSTSLAQGCDRMGQTYVLGGPEPGRNTPSKALLFSADIWHYFGHLARLRPFSLSAKARGTALRLRSRACEPSLGGAAASHCPGLSLWSVEPRASCPYSGWQAVRRKRRSRERTRNRWTEQDVHNPRGLAGPEPSDTDHVPGTVIDRGGLPLSLGATIVTLFGPGARAHVSSP